MVRLRVTASMADALAFCREQSLDISTEEAALADSSQRDWITHDQVIALSEALGRFKETSKHVEVPPYNLAVLLKGSEVYIEPPKTKAEPTSEYKALMARLREEEEERQYERMINPPQPMQSFGQKFPETAHTHLFPQISKQEEDEEVTFSDINRQVTLIFNILISIVACAVAIWMATRYWPTPQRLGVSMGGGGLVGVAEVVVYAGYLRRVQEAKQKEKRKVEKKEIIDTWVIEPKANSTSKNNLEKVNSKLVASQSLTQRTSRKQSSG